MRIPNPRAMNDCASPVVEDVRDDLDNLLTAGGKNGLDLLQVGARSAGDLSSDVAIPVDVSIALVAGRSAKDVVAGDGPSSGHCGEARLRGGVHGQLVAAKVLVGGDGAGALEAVAGQTGRGRRRRGGPARAAAVVGGAGSSLAGGGGVGLLVDLDDAGEDLVRVQ